MRSRCFGGMVFGMFLVPTLWAAPPSESFTYQGQLKQDGFPLTGNVDLKITLWDDPVTNMANPPILDRLNVAVVEGLFSVSLDFPASSFQSARWVGIQVRTPAGSGNPYVTLNPRQPVAAAPYAMYALNSPGGAGGTLNQAYNFGGPGAGRTITADAGPVTLTGTGGLTISSGGARIGPVRLSVDTSNFDVEVARGPVFQTGQSQSVTLGGMVTTGSIGSPVPHWAHLRVGNLDHRIMRDSGSDFRFAVEGTPNAQIVTDQLTLKDTGRLGIGTTTPAAMLHVNDNTDLTPTGGGTLVLGSTTSQNLVFDGNEIMARNNGAPSALTINLEGGNVGIGTSPSSLARLHVNVPNTDGDTAFYAVSYGSGRAALFEHHQSNTTHAVSIFKNNGPALRVSGNVSATNAATDAPLSVIGGSDTAAAGGGFAVFGSTNSNNISIDNNEIMARNNGSLAPLSLNADGGNVYISQSGSGNLGVGTSSPKGKIHVDGDYYGLGHLWLHAYEGDNVSGTAYIQARDTSTTTSIDLRLRTKAGTTLNDNIVLKSNGRVGIGTASPAQLLHVNGTARVNVLQITGGADLSENFNVSGNDLEPGMVVAIDPDNPGQLRLASTAYDPTVAGVISGAGGVGTGMIMAHEGTVADGQHPVALTGRVYCRADATHGAIRPGDLLTTSDTPGHAMKVMDRERANGAILGKAMTALPEGERGLVLVLVSLQ